jgi:peroxidase
MALNIWTVGSGFSLGSFAEELPVDLPLPLLPGAAFNGVPPASYDGTGHHPTAPLRNSAGAPFARGPVNSYVDGIHQMRSDLPNARTVSNLVVKDAVNHGNQPDPNGYSGFMYAFGQFLTHDLEFARPGTGNIDIIVPAGDTELTPGSHIPVTRNAVAPNTGTDVQHPALPMNDVTGWIDASVVYGVAYPPGVPQGPTPFQNPVNLREGGQIATTGKLSTSSNGQYAPIVNNAFVFGDPRGTENPDLTSMQTLFIREHNWHVTRLKTLHPTWTGEQLYQRARSIVVAEFQNITYKEWLPKVIGPGHIPEYAGFNFSTDGTITIEFAAAAMRFGHSIVSGAQDRVDEQGNILESLTLAQAFFLTPAQFERNGGADGFIRKLASDISNKLDVYIIDDLRNLLDDPPAALDLAATNIQRGRDLGLPSLNQMRVALGFPAYTTFDQITTNGTVANALQTAYVDINKIDLWVGGLAEDPATAAMVGPTFQAIMIDQFIRLRDGDQQWFENQPWSTSDLEWLHATTLSDIILRNTDTVRMQSDAFVAVERADLYNGNVATITARAGGVNIPGTDSANISFNVISGKLPGGLRVAGARLQGNPYIVSNDTKYNFCIRASNGTDIADRSFFITITGNNQPSFVDLPGSLPIGPAKQLYVLDSTHISYQIEAFDLNVAVGQTLTYFIASEDGALPKGITLSPSGVLSGFIEPTIKIMPTDGNGTYDASFFDRVAYDFANRPSDGFDSYKYDNVFFDYNLASAPPTTLNVNYQFRVTLTDGVNYAQRIFKIFVVGTDQFRADSTSFNGVADGFTSDSTYLRAPVWITDPNLGSFRANNYLTVPIALYDNLDVIFRLEPTNEEVYAVTYQVSNTDNITGFTFQGRLTQNNAIVTNVTNISSLTVGQTISGFNIARGTVISNKTNSTITLSIPALGNATLVTLTAGGDELTVSNVNGTIQAGQYLTFDNYLDGATGTVYKIASVSAPLVNGAFRIKLYSLLEMNIPNGVPFYIGTLSQLPSGINFDPGTGDIYGQLPYQPAITTNYRFTITATRIGDTIEEYLNASKTFNMSVLGNIDSVISWNTPSNLGIIPANYISTLAVSASTTVPNAVLIYQLVGGKLPPGLTLNLDGEIIGTTNQYYNTFKKTLGLTSFDSGHLTFDQNTATIDRVFVATIEARDQFNYSAITRDFKITVTTPNTVAYSNIVARPFLKLNQRALWKSFINNSSIFTPSSIYRNNDTSFGVQSDLTMLVYAGVQTKEAAAYVGAMGLNFKRKRFQFSNIKKAIAIDPNTGNSVYEVIYVQMIDPQETDGKHLPISITSLPGLESDNITADNSINFFQQTIDDLNTNSPFGGPDIPQLTVDSTGYEVSNPKPDTYFPNSITNWQTRLEGVGLTERNYLPLWMRSIPNGQKQQLGYTLSVPLCFCKPGTADDIILNIKYSKFDFKVLDYEIDRFTIDSVTGYQGDKYLVFRNDRITV